ncbi:GH15687 [Drosophila grimshawi]|uniref:GH15687 n=1 Tax=Drosophila grimshawi TaxID=7222 RepID=B4JUJ1_DROGR|nr:GH15687 [Drosophila grimshawi]
MASAISGYFSAVFYSLRFGINVGPCKLNYEYRESCSQDAAIPPDNCSSGFYMIMVRDCPKYFCFRKLNEICYPGDDTTRCAPGQVCSCNKCMNCSGAICHMELCPNNYPYVYKKRLSNRLLPWIYRGRLQNVSQKIVEPNYDD